MIPYRKSRLRYHPPTEAQRLVYETINDAFCEMVPKLCEVLPDTADSMVALRQIELARMACNAALALADEPLTQ